MSISLSSAHNSVFLVQQLRFNKWIYYLEIHKQQIPNKVDVEPNLPISAVAAFNNIYQAMDSYEDEQN
ncbi:hypothetical protein SLEP1_g11190 [Rubroshorea leprosula]|uniref:Uncharacterized protein n=1 Tax=Rubroshorea leprosula TaxID=152421 RepID=A0AAV5ILX3_9ROSI|nr:hypothetical protein SLEP1_g11190 [Rubroshorea leprosula]